MSVDGINFGSNYLGTAAAGYRADIKEEVANKKRNIFGGQSGKEITPEQRAKLLEEINKIIKKNGKINPFIDKVYIDPQTGKRTTWQPGLVVERPKDFKHPENPGLIPDKEITDNNKATAKKRLAALGAVLLTAGLAFLFRGKIKGGVSKAAEALKPYLEKLTTGGKNVWGKAVKSAGEFAGKAKTFAADLYKSVKTAAAPVLNKAKTVAKDLYKTAKEAAAPVFEGAKNYLSKLLKKVH